MIPSRFFSQAPTNLKFFSATQVPLPPPFCERQIEVVRRVNHDFYHFPAGSLYPFYGESRQTELAKEVLAKLKGKRVNLITYPVSGVSTFASDPHKVLIEKAGLHRLKALQTDLKLTPLSHRIHWFSLRMNSLATQTLLDLLVEVNGFHHIYLTDSKNIPVEEPVKK